MNTTLLEESMKLLAASPDTLSMMIWDNGKFCCIGGFIGRAAGQPMEDNLGMVDTEAQKAHGRNVHKVSVLLGVTYEQAYSLTCVSYWPIDLWMAYHSTPDVKADRPKVALERIEMFIASGGVS